MFGFHSIRTGKKSHGTNHPRASSGRSDGVARKTRPAPPAIERLENRVAPAGILNLQVIGSNVVIKAEPGTDGDSSITLSTDTSVLDAGSLRVTPDAGTSIRFLGNELSPGESAFLPSFTGTLSVALGAGADSVTLQGDWPKAVTIDLGSGSNSALLGGSIGGKLLVKGGDGADNVTLEGDFQAAFDVNLSLANGSNTFNTGPNITLARNLTVTTGAGEDKLSPAFTGNARIGGNLLINSGSGADVVTVIGENLLIGGNVTFKSQGATGANIQQRLDAAILVIHGNVSFSVTTTAQHILEIGATSASMFVGGGVTIKSPQASSVLSHIFVGSVGTAQIGKTVTVLAGKEGETEIWGINDSSYFGGAITVKGGRSINLVSDGIVAEKVSFTTTSSDIGNILVANGIGGKLRLFGAVTLSTPTSTAGTTQVMNTYFFNSLTIQDGGGVRSVTVQSVAITGSLSVLTGAGTDTILMGNEASVRLGGALKIIAGDGADSIGLGGGDGGKGFVTFGPALVDGGSGTDVYSQGAAAIFASPPVLKNIP